MDELLATMPPPLRPRINALTMHCYPRADDAKHLASLVRTRRDPLATRWLRGMISAVLAGATLGALVNGVLAGVFGMFGDLVGIAIGLGCLLGAFLGGFTAAMTGTAVPRRELQTLWPNVRAGDVLVQWSGDDREALAVMREQAEARQMPSVLLTRDSAWETKRLRPQPRHGVRGGR